MTASGLMYSDTGKAMGWAVNIFDNLRINPDDQMLRFCTPCVAHTKDPAKSLNSVLDQLNNGLLFKVL